MVVKLNGVRYDCASSWKDPRFTTKQYIRIVKEWDRDKDIADRDYFKLLNILTDGKFDSYQNTSENDITILDTVGWVITEEFKFDKKMPKVLAIGDRIIEIPPDPAELSIGQNIHLRRDFIDHSEIPEENIAIATAIFLQPIIDGKKFHLERAKELAKEIEKMPAYLIYPIGFFLLQRCMNFGNPSVRIWNRIKISLKQMLKKMSPTWPK
jgi:hypothetical protein